MTPAVTSGKLNPNCAMRTTNSPSAKVDLVCSEHGICTQALRNAVLSYYVLQIYFEANTIENNKKIKNKKAPDNYVVRVVVRELNARGFIHLQQTSHKSIYFSVTFSS